MTRAWCLLALWTALAPAAACAPGNEVPADAGPADASPDPRALLRIEQPGGEPGGKPGGKIVLEARAEVARTEDERRRGLRGHAPLAAGEALLIELPLELDDICVVNDGVTFAIDAVFVRADGIVVAIERSIPAGDARPRCHDRTRWIVEIAADQARDVAPGARMIID